VVVDVVVGAVVVVVDAGMDEVVVEAASIVVVVDSPVAEMHVPTVVVVVASDGDVVVVAADVDVDVLVVCAMASAALTAMTATARNAATVNTTNHPTPVPGCPSVVTARSYPGRETARQSHTVVRVNALRTLSPGPGPSATTDSGLPQPRTAARELLRSPVNGAQTVGEDLGQTIARSLRMTEDPRAGDWGSDHQAA